MIGDNFRAVAAEVAAATARRQSRGLIAEAVTLIAVTKNHGVAAMREAIDAGAAAIGENRVQEAKAKFPVLERDVKKHLIGHLQTNKAQSAVGMFDLIHSVDSERLLRAVDAAAAKIGKVQEILLQVNLAHEETKFGLDERELPALLELAGSLPHVKASGLMCIAPECADPEETRPLFRRMYEIFCRAKKMPGGENLAFLSMGMSGDYRVAIEEGANLVRVGTAIFGARQYNK